MTAFWMRLPPGWRIERREPVANPAGIVVGVEHSWRPGWFRATARRQTPGQPHEPTAVTCFGRTPAEARTIAEKAAWRIVREQSNGAIMGRKRRESVAAMRAIATFKERGAARG